MELLSCASTDADLAAAWRCYRQHVHSLAFGVATGMISVTLHMLCFSSGRVQHQAHSYKPGITNAAGEHGRILWLDAMTADIAT